MKQYIITLVLLIAALVAFSTSHANAQSQAEMTRQAAKDFEKVDVQLNSIYKEVLAGLDAEGKKKLQVSQRAWIAFRDAEAAFQADGERGGSNGALNLLDNGFRADSGSHRGAAQAAFFRATREKTVGVTNAIHETPNHLTVLYYPSAGGYA